MKRIVLISIIIVFFFGSIKAQLSTAERPYSWEKGKGEVNIGSIPIIHMPNLDLETLNREDSENEGFGIPYRFGFTHEVYLTLSNSGIWNTTSDGGRLWNLKIYSPDAISLNLLYDKFWLPDGAKFFLYAEDMKQHIGAFTSLNNRGDEENIKGFATCFLFSNSIILEYYEPQGVDNSGIISISNIVSGYRTVYDNNYRGIPDELNCLHDINCVGEHWQDAKNAIALMVMGGSSCSGALLNNTANDNAPLFLSAEHCFVSSPSTEDWFFLWNFETSECDTVILIENPDPSKSTLGATLLAKRKDTDFMLLELIEDPTTNNNVTLYYLGWERVYPSSLYHVCISHPSGIIGGRPFPKTWALSQYPVLNHPDTICWGDENCSQGISLPNTNWRVVITDGLLYRGSSGSPLINYNKRVIGQLQGGNHFCAPPVFPNTFSFFGRFDLSWDGPNSSMRLKDWLDPLNTNDSILNGTSVCRDTLMNQIITNNRIIVGCNTLYIQDVAITDSAIVLITAKQEVIINHDFLITPGTDVWIKIDNPIDKVPPNTLLSNDEIMIIDQDFSNLAKINSEIIENHLDFTLYPNPNSGSFNIDANFPLTEISNLKISNLLGVTIYEAQNLTSNSIQLSSPVSGIVFVIIILKDCTLLTQKMLIQR